MGSLGAHSPYVRNMTRCAAHGTPNVACQTASPSWFNSEERTASSSTSGAWSAGGGSAFAFEHAPPILDSRRAWPVSYEQTRSESQFSLRIASVETCQSDSHTAHNTRLTNHLHQRSPSTHGRAADSPTHLARRLLIDHLEASPPEEIGADVEFRFGFVFLNF
jgi:hypothetical protein